MSDLFLLQHFEPIWVHDLLEMHVLDLTVQTELLGVRDRIFQ